MREIPRFSATDILRELCARGVEFIVVGGVAAVLEGVPVHTFDLDIVHSRRPDNVVRLLAALDALNAIYRAQPELAQKPRGTHLLSPRRQLLMTRFGPLDVLGSIGRSRGFDDLSPCTHEIEVAEGLRVRVLDLESLIAVKEEVANERDLAVLPLMRRTLDARRRS